MSASFKKGFLTEELIQSFYGFIEISKLMENVSVLGNFQETG